ncbi:MAG: hypothetical protein R6U68_00260 [Desulfobacteraceae bacterium]
MRKSMMGKKEKNRNAPLKKDNVFTRFINWVAKGSRRAAEKGDFCST